MCGFSCNTYFGPSGNTCVPVWTQETSGVTDDLFDIWGSSKTDVYVVGRKKILHSTGNGVWTTQATVTGFADFRGVWGDKSNPQHVWAVGGIGAIWRTANSGASWAQENSPSGNAQFYAVGGAGFTQLFALGDKVIGRDSTMWTEIAQSVTARFKCVQPLGFGSYMYAGADNGRVYESTFSPVFAEKYNTGWAYVSGISGGGAHLWFVGPSGSIGHADTGNDVWGAPAQTSNTTANLNDVWVPFDLQGAEAWAVGANGTIVRYAGNNTWQPETSNTTASLAGVWGPSDGSEIYAVGAGGTIMHFKK
jgi:photosystem II stability/assembly factor-like uncharacterized protein